MFPDVIDIPNEETSEYMRNSLDLWTAIKNNYDSGFLNKNEWNFLSCDHKIFQQLELLLVQGCLKNYHSRTIY